MQAGLAVSRKLYGIVKQRGYRMSFIGGGAAAFITLPSWSVAT